VKSEKSRELTIMYDFAESCKARIRLEIEIGMEFDQSKERKPLLRLVNFVLIGQIPIQSQSQFLV